MKLPFDFGIKLLFRLLLPGFVLTLGLSPLIFFGLDWANWPESHVYVLIIVILLSGWLILVSDMPIYMIFEGRRYWPIPLRKRMVKREKLRLEGLQKKTDLARLESIETREQRLEAENLDQTARKKLEEEIESDNRDFIEAYFDIRNFPISDKGNYQAKFPTRLGNLIFAYEDYSTRVYGMDTMFYWPRIWLNLDKDLREDIDNRQAIVDSTVYVSFASFASAAIWFVYAVIGSANALILAGSKSAVFTPSHTLFEHLPRWWLLWLLAALFLFAGFLVYRISLRLHAQFGEVFKSVFDVFGDKINVTTVIGDVAEYSGDYSLLALGRKKRLEVAWRYLQFGLIKCSICGKRIAAAKMTGHSLSHNVSGGAAGVPKAE
jgi:hypothetical protein